MTKHNKIELSEKDINRFWAKVNKISNDGCWEWAACKSTDGYGQISIKYKMYNAHRISWVLHNGEIPVGLCVCHTCDNPSCVNPAHLFLGTSKDNSNDRDKKGRGVTPDNKGDKNGSHKLTEKQVIEIRQKYVQYKYTQSVLAKEYGVSKQNIRNIVIYKTWKHVAQETG